MVPVLVAVIGGYLLGSVPVAVLVGRAHGFDPRDVGDRNPGFWNVRERLGWKAAVPVFAGDMLKGTAAGLAGLAAGGGDVLPVYAAVAAAMIGHAWPVFAGGRGGRSILTFAGGFAVICLPAFVLGVVLLVATSLLLRSFAWGTRVAVFSLPALQLAFAPAAYVAGTGALMCLIGLRFGQAALTGRRAGQRAGRGPGRTAGRRAGRRA
ncbi:glycerol-3-phosphate acyltransferase [Actinomadura graeca]|uniref:Glycerol-3-phosphate acyltransferase n=2 Tax=Actinomadura graeca TaxID=2750812 RepID=A0ABX8R6V6_9ACTN|nr:glycerol-3-phosphate acyltransferase [Actinomadura graeca]